MRSWRSSCRDETLTLANIGFRCDAHGALPDARAACAVRVEHEQAELDDQADLLGDG
jgi:hypothetical protein